MFNRFSLKLRLLVVFLISGCFLGLVGLLGFLSLTYVSRQYNHIATVNLNAATRLATMDSNAKNIQSRLLQLTLPGNTPQEMARIKKGINDNRVEYEQMEESYLALYPAGLQGEEKEFHDNLAGIWKKFGTSLDGILPLAMTTTSQSRERFADLYRGELKDIRYSLSNALDKLSEFQGEEGDRWVKAAERSSKIATIMSFAVGFGGFFISMGLGLLFTNNLVRGLSGATQRLEKSAGSVGSTSHDVFSSSEAVASSVTQQAAALQQTSAAAEELSAMVARNAEAATKSREVSAGSTSAALQGKEAVEQTVRAIEEIDRSNIELSAEMEKNNREIASIVKVISEIGEKTKVINDIVFQTKLLSFNASVEAARAGEQGKGFAVVAEEVGNLAQMSGIAAREITQMLDESIQKVNAIIKQASERVQGLVLQGKEKVSQGVSVARECGNVLDEVVKNVQHVDNLISEISTASMEQDSGLREIVKAVGELENTNQQNSTSSSNAANASQQLSNQADGLKSLVGELQSIVQGKMKDIKST